MLKVRGWNVQVAMWWCASGYVVGGLQHFSVSPSPLGTNLVLELNETQLGFGLGWTKGLGPGLDKSWVTQKYLLSHTSQNN